MAHWEHRDRTDAEFSSFSATVINVCVDYPVPAGAETCHFTMVRASDEEREHWGLLIEKLERQALRVVQES